MFGQRKGRNTKEGNQKKASSPFCFESFLVRKSEAQYRIVTQTCRPARPAGHRWCNSRNGHGGGKAEGKWIMARLLSILLLCEGGYRIIEDKWHVSKVSKLLSRMPPAQIVENCHSK